MRGGTVMLHIIRHERGDCDASHYQTLQHGGAVMLHIIRHYNMRGGL